MTKAEVEAIIFASGKPVAVKAIARVLNGSVEDVKTFVETLKSECNTETSGVHLLEHEGQVQFVTNPAHGALIASLVKDEFAGELTRPQLETLSVICYRGPVTKPEIEQIRGVNCSVIIRNLLIRGLVEEKEDATRLQSVYTVSTDFVRHLGVSTLVELPDYERFHTDERIAKLIEEAAVTPSVEQG